MTTMTHLCVTCGTQYPPANQPPEHCPICEDERQFVGLQGQQWITLEKLQQTHRNTFFQEGEGVWGIQTVPDFGIGQRALLVRSGKRNSATSFGIASASSTRIRSRSLMRSAGFQPSRSPIPTTTRPCSSGARRLGASRSTSTKMIVNGYSAPIPVLHSGAVRLAI